MEMGSIVELNFITGSIGATLGFAVSIILLVANKEESLSRKLLSGIVFCLSLFSLTYGLIGTQFFIKFPFSWRIPAIFSGILPPLLYLYVRSVLYQEFRLRKHDALFFIPAVLMFIHFLPFYILSDEEKRAILVRMFSNKKLALIEVDGLFPSGVGMIIRSSTGLLFTFLAISQIYKSKNKLPLKKETDLNQNKGVYKWLVFLLICISFSYVLLIMWNFLAISSKIEFFVAIGFTTAGLIFTICAYLFLQPNILYGLQGWVKSPVVSPVFSLLEQNDINRQLQNESVSFFSPEMQVELRSSLENHFKNNKPFIASGYKIKDLSSELDIPVYLISSFINQEYGKNFNELINDYRVDYIADVLKESPDSQNFTLEAIAKTAGFNSRNTFIGAVKKKSGLTPSSYFNKKIN
jgi:AraC-like DNA-binding protein